MSRKSAFAVLSTNSKKFPGFPLGSIVGFAVDEQGRPFFSFRYNEP
jgi:putative heme iron utilization protein